MLFPKVINHFFKKYILRTVFIETVDNDCFSVLEWKRIQSVEIDDIDATPYELLSLIYNDKENHRSNRWRRPYGGVL